MDKLVKLVDIDFIRLVVFFCFLIEKYITCYQLLQLRFWCRFILMIVYLQN